LVIQSGNHGEHMIRIWLASLLLCLASVAMAGVQLEWDKSLDGGSNALDRAADIAFDATGNSYLLSERTINVVDKRDVVVTKFTPAGVQVWQKIMPDRIDADDLAGKLVTTPNEVIFTMLLNTASGKKALLTSLKQTDGTQVFQADLGRMDSIPGLAAPSPATIYVAGTAPYSTVNQVLVFCFNGAGTKLSSNSWQAGLTATVDVDALKADGDGFVVVGTVDRGSDAFPYVLAFDKVGDERWDYIIMDGIQASRGTSLEILNQNYYVSTTSNRWREGSISRFDASGLRKWHNGFGAVGSGTMFGPSTQGLGTPFVMFSTASGWGAARYFPNSSLGVPFGPYPDTSDLVPSHIAFDGARVILCGVGGDGIPVVKAYLAATKAESWDYSGAGSVTDAQVAVSPDGSIYLYGQRNAGGGNVLLTRLTQTVAVKSLTLNMNSAYAGQSVVATVKLFEPAPLSGSPVTLASADPAVTFVGGTAQTVAGGQDTLNVNLQLTPVATSKTILLSALGGGGIQQVNLQLIPPPIVGIDVQVKNGNQYFSQTARFGGEDLLFKVELAGKAPASFAVAVTRPAGFGIPSSLTIPAGQTVLYYPFKTPATFATFSTTLKASRNGITKSKFFTVKGVELSYLQINNTSSPGTLPVEATVPFDVNANMDGIAPGNYSVAMSDDLSIISSSSITVLAGKRKGTKSYTATIPSATTYGKLTFSVNGKSLIQKIAVTRGSLKSVSGPGTIKAGTIGAITVTLNKAAPSGGVKFQLKYGPGLSKLGITKSEFTVTAGKSSLAIGLKPPSGTSADGFLVAEIDQYYTRGSALKVTP